ncbi:MAG: 16S rRNA (uracil(1498)-N(3))-methyltransferase [Myxococcaceae bacterium]|nr:16S rRNA (uracil(1498)-N(3))-methyltransferase [Myxococcaceae bacterium]
MNLLLLEPSELGSDGTARLRDRRLQHAREVLRAREGDSLRVGVLGGAMGTARVAALTKEELVLETVLTEPAPPRAGVDLLLAIPRPKALKKVLPAIASLGVDRVVLLNAARVEKSYFDSKVLVPEFLNELVRLGLEQGRDTIAPELIVRERFKPFVEDELRAWLRDGTACFTPHPGAPEALPRRAPGQRAALAIGPEGGWVPFEVSLLEAHGFRPVSVGARPLRVEVAVPVLLGALGL